MASQPAARISLAPDGIDRAIGLGAVLLLGATLTALARGQQQWGQVPPLVWGHLGSAVLAMGLTPVMLWRRR
ncbi:MAG: hypothetical protein JSS36_04185, partial [Proteobacteria bacterium]|nr:hypothetical protein [Pseudomonadota bacterium]